MATIHTVTVLVERVVVSSLTWDIDEAEYAEWAGHPFNLAEPQNVKEFIEADRFYGEAVRDKIRDTAPEQWVDAYKAGPVTEITKVVIL